MKRLLLSLALLLSLTINMNAQAPHRRAPYRHAPVREYQHRPYRQAHVFDEHMGEVRFHVYGDLGTEDLSAIFFHEIPYHFTVGGMVEYQPGHALSLGVGAEYYTSYGEDCYLLRNMHDTYIHTLPIYANLRLSVPSGPIRPFVEGRIGYSAPMGEVSCADADGVHYFMSTGLYTGAAMGIDIYGLNLSFGVSAIDVVSSPRNTYYDREVITDFYFRLGYAFGGAY